MINVLVTTLACCWIAPAVTAKPGETFLSKVFPAAAVANAEHYLSDEEFPGYHIVSQSSDGSGMRVYPKGKRPAPGDAPLIIAADDIRQWQTMKDVRQALVKVLRIRKREPLQPKWDIFNAQGQRIKDVDVLRQIPVAVVVEIGQWMWPGVREGFEQKAEYVNKEQSATLRTLSLRPLVFEIHDFLTAEETEEVMRLGRNAGLHKSQGVLQTADLKKAHSEFRTSSQAWLDNYASPLIDELDKRIANLTRIPTTHNEPVQLLRYDENQYYHGHMDWGELELYKGQPGMMVQNHYGYKERMATLFWYLNDVADGGETIFPKYGQPICFPDSRGGEQTRHCPGAQDPDMQQCTHGLKVRPRRGTVILWYNYLASARGDRNALHAGCPVGKGLTKWSANKWVSTKPLHERGEEIPNHPALKRYGWDVPPAPNTCMVSFSNEFSHPIDLMWVNPSSGGLTKLLTVPPGSDRSQSSFTGHEFLMQHGDRRSNKVACKVSGNAFSLSNDFVLRSSSSAEL